MALESKELDDNMAPKQGGRRAHRHRGEVMFAENLTPDPDMPLSDDEGGVSSLKSSPTAVKSADTAALITAALNTKNALFSSLSPEEVAEVVSGMQCVHVEAGGTLIREGDEAREFYVVEQGALDVFKDGKQVNECTAGDLIGELALLYNMARSATVVAATHCRLWSMERSAFRKTVAQQSTRRLRLALDALANVPLLQDLTGSQLTQLAAAVQTVSYPTGAEIIRKGDVGDVFFMIQEGSVVCTDIGSGGVPDVTLGPSDYFGERALLLAEPRAANVRALSHVTCFTLGRDLFVTLLGPLHDTMERAALRRSLPFVPLFRRLQPHLVDALAECFTLQSFPAGTVITERGKPCDSLFVVKSGSLSIAGPLGGDAEGGDADADADAGAGTNSGPSSARSTPFLGEVCSPRAPLSSARRPPAGPPVATAPGEPVHSLSPARPPVPRPTAGGSRPGAPKTPSTTPATTPRGAAGRCVGKYFGAEGLLPNAAQPDRRWLAVLTNELGASPPPSPSPTASDGGTDSGRTTGAVVTPVQSAARCVTAEVTVSADSNVQVYKLPYDKLATELAAVGLRVSRHTGSPVQVGTGMASPAASTASRSPAASPVAARTPSRGSRTSDEGSDPFALPASVAGATVATHGDTALSTTAAAPSPVAVAAPPPGTTMEATVDSESPTPPPAAPSSTAAPATASPRASGGAAAGAGRPSPPKRPSPGRRTSPGGKGGKGGKGRGKGRGSASSGSSPRRGGVKLEDLTRLRTLGVGAFGRVFLVRHEPTGKAYALKEMEKVRLIRCKQTNNVLSEKRVMQQLSHPFLLGLVTTYRDEHKLYMLMELVQGGELFSVLSRHDRLKPAAARFYGACVLAGLEAMHLAGVVYRDLKPENILIDQFGYCKLVDFGFAKRVTSRTFTLCGTPEYMAPELVLGKGYNRSADVWALGILLYEMLVGRTPFADTTGAGNKMKICENIIRGGLRFPKDMYTESVEMGPARRVIRALLEPSVIRRLGCQKRGAVDIKNAPFFRNVSWSLLCRRKVRAPWVPDLSGPFDSTFFDEEYDENEEAGAAATAKPAEAEVQAMAARLPVNWDQEFDSDAAPPALLPISSAVAPGRPPPALRTGGRRVDDTRTKLLRRNHTLASPRLMPTTPQAASGGGGFGGFGGIAGLMSPSADSVAGEMNGGMTPLAARLQVDTGDGRTAPGPQPSPDWEVQPSPANSVMAELHTGATPRRAKFLDAGGRDNPLAAAATTPAASSERAASVDTNPWTGQASPANSVMAELFTGATPRAQHLLDARGRDNPVARGGAGDNGGGDNGGGDNDGGDNDGGDPRLLARLQDSPASVTLTQFKPSGATPRAARGGGGGGGAGGDTDPQAPEVTLPRRPPTTHTAAAAATPTMGPRLALQLPPAAAAGGMFSPTSSIAGELVGGSTPAAARLQDPLGRRAPVPPLSTTTPRGAAPMSLLTPSASSVAGELNVGATPTSYHDVDPSGREAPTAAVDGDSPAPAAGARGAGIAATPRTARVLQSMLSPVPLARGGSGKAAKVGVKGSGAVAAAGKVQQLVKGLLALERWAVRAQATAVAMKFCSWREHARSPPTTLARGDASPQPPAGGHTWRRVSTVESVEDLRAGVRRGSAVRRTSRTSAMSATSGVSDQAVKPAPVRHRTKSRSGGRGDSRRRAPSSGHAPKTPTVAAGGGTTPSSSTAGRSSHHRRPGKHSTRRGFSNYLAPTASSRAAATTRHSVGPTHTSRAFGPSGASGSSPPPSATSAAPSSRRRRGGGRASLDPRSTRRRGASGNNNAASTPRHTSPTAMIAGGHTPSSTTTSRRPSRARKPQARRVSVDNKAPAPRRSTSGIDTAAPLRRLEASVHALETTLQDFPAP